jgi:hypothetical protein
MWIITICAFMWLNRVCSYTWIIMYVILESKRTWNSGFWRSISSGFRSRTTADNPGLSAAAHLQLFRNRIWWQSITAADDLLYSSVWTIKLRNTPIIIPILICSACKNQLKGNWWLILNHASGYYWVRFMRNYHFLFQISKY